MTRQALVLRRERVAGRLEETADGVRFTYDADYLRDATLPPVSLTLPRRAAAYTSQHLFPCFVALLAEGALADEQCRRLRIDERDLFGRLLATGAGDCIGSLRIVAVPA
jgi:serine/threonine-protein kinase HipA